MTVRRQSISARTPLQYAPYGRVSRIALTSSQKEPKLARARQIPEWEVYDGEIARLARRLADEGVIRASAAAADVSDLANAASGKISVSSEGAVEASGQKEVDEDEAQHIKHEEL